MGDYSSRRPDQLIGIDKATPGLVTLLGSLTDVEGMGFVPAPEPATFCLLAVSLLEVLQPGRLRIRKSVR